MLELLLVSTLTVSYPYDWAPGMLNPDCTVEKVCTPGYTRTIRPPVSYTNKLKVEQMREHSLPGTVKDYEEDHVVPLEACGHPTSPENLSPEPYPSARDKDKVENWWHYQICVKGWTPNQVLQDIPNWRWRYENGQRCNNPECK